MRGYIIDANGERILDAPDRHRYPPTQGGLPVGRLPRELRELIAPVGPLELEPIIRWRMGLHPYTEVRLRQS